MAKRQARDAAGSGSEGHATGALSLRPLATQAKPMTDIIAISVFYEFAALLVLAAGVGLVGLALRQPLIVSFIAVGILAASAWGIARSSEYIQLFAELGVVVLLFLVGLKLDLKLIRTLGTVALTTGLGQVIFTSVLGFLICLELGLDALTSLYVAVALTFSSTIIIVKLLSDKKEIDSLHGQIALGILIVQDLVVVLAMAVLSALGSGVAARRAAARDGDGAGLRARSARRGRPVHPLSGGAVGAPGGQSARAPDLLRDRLGDAARGGRRLSRPGQGARRSAGRRLARLDAVPREHRYADGAAARFPRPVLLHRARRTPRPRPVGSGSGRGGRALAVRPGRQTGDRADHHGAHGLSQAHRVPGRPDASPRSASSR